MRPGSLSWVTPQRFLSFPEDGSASFLRALRTRLHILDKFWGYGGGSMMLKRWRLGFNPTTEYFSFLPYLGSPSGASPPVVEPVGCLS
jgi:hypothetical protein